MTAGHGGQNEISPTHPIQFKLKPPKAHHPSRRRLRTRYYNCRAWKTEWAMFHPSHPIQSHLNPPKAHPTHLEKGWGHGTTTAGHGRRDDPPAPSHSVPTQPTHSPPTVEEDTVLILPGRPDGMSSVPLIPSRTPSSPNSTHSKPIQSTLEEAEDTVLRLPGLKDRMSPPSPIPLQAHPKPIPPILEEKAEDTALLLPGMEDGMT